MYKRRLNIWHEYCQYDAEIDKLSENEINLTYYVLCNQATGLIYDIPLLLALKPECLFIPKSKSRLFYIPRWFVLLYKSLDKKRKKFYSFIVANLNLIEEFRNDWLQNKSLHNLYTILNNNGFQTPPIENLYKFSYLGKIVRYFVKEKCWEEHRSITSWSNVNQEDFSRQQPLNEEEATKLRIVNIYMERN